MTPSKARSSHHHSPAEAPLMLSVSGARGIVGETMTPAVAANFAAAFGSHVRSQPTSAKLRSTRSPYTPLICIGRDSRPSGQMLAQAAMAGLASVGCRVLDLGVVTTPSVAVMINRHRATGGMVITASHNPIQWNGLKCLNADGVAPPPEIANTIIARFKNNNLQYVSVSEIPEITQDDTTHEVHVNRVLEQVDVRRIRKVGFTVVLDSVNGAGCVVGRMVLERLGCTIVHINGEPTGHFAHTPEPVEANLKDLAARTRRVGAVVGFAQDPDADRLAIIDERGRYIGEEYTLALAAQRMLQRASQAAGSGASGTGKAGKMVLAANLSTSRMIGDIAAAFGARVIRTAVGEANVVAALKPHGRRALLGGEGNGGVILPQVCWVRDSLTAMAIILELLATSGESISDWVERLPRYVMIKHKFDLKDLGGLPVVRTAMERVVRRFADQDVSTIDGVRVDCADGWVHLRPSNTEPIVRLIAEAKTESRAWELIDEVAVAAGLR